VRQIGFVSHFLVVGVADWVGFVKLHPGRLGGNPDFDISGSKRDAAVWRARFVTPPVFGVALSSIRQRIIPPMKSSMSSDIFSVTLKFLH
jgi:hypothetical protein